MHKVLEQGWNLFNEGKLEEALQLLAIFENLEDLNPEDKHYYRFLKGFIYCDMGRYQESLEIAAQDYLEFKSQNKVLFLIDSLYLKRTAVGLRRLYAAKGNLDLLLASTKEEQDFISSGKLYISISKEIVSYEPLLKSLTEEPLFEVELREGLLNFINGYYSFGKNKFDEAIELHKRSLEIFENNDLTLSSVMVPLTLNVLGHAYSLKGELDIALESHKRSLDLFRGNSINTIQAIGATFTNMGEIYFQKGDLDQAIENYEKSLKIVEYNSEYLVSWVVRNYDCLIKVFLYKGSYEKAREYLERFNQYLEKNKISKDFRGYKLITARFMRSSSRIRERAEAEKILKEIIVGHKALKDTRRRLPEEFSVALVELCDFYLEELRLTNDLKIIDDIQPLVIRLLKEAERTNSYTLQVQSYLLYGKISLLLMNMGDARRYLVEAQQIADSHSLQLLAREISHQHDKLLEQLEGLESYKKKKISISERMNLASLDDTMDLMQGKRTINAPKLTDEEPVLLLILAGGGNLLFSYPFSDEVKVEDELFGGFLSAITTFSDEALSEGLDRAKFGQYTVLMENLEVFYFCYLFKGQTYVAKKKLSDFTENFQKNISMMETLNKFNQTSQVIELKDFPFLEGFIKGIFTKN